MPLTPSLIHALKQDNPSLEFVEADDFMWLPDTHTVRYRADDPDADALVLHEVSHALLGHSAYTRDIELVAMETAAWHHAATLAPTYEVALRDDLAQENLDSYRDWLHARSTCPGCTATGVQVLSHTYRCVACSRSWNVNDAKSCQLRRYVK